MNGRKAAIGLAVLCALAVSAFSAPTASANTAYKCESVGSGASFSDAHCLTAGSGSGFKHTAIANNTPTSITVSNANTASGTSAAAVAKLKGVLVGVATEVQCTTVSGSGSIENREGGAEMWSEGTGVLEFSGCSVTVPSGIGCVVSGGAFTTIGLFVCTQGLTNQMQVEPASGTEIAAVTIEKCSTTALNKKFPVTGSLILNTSGATASTTHVAVTTLGTLKWGGQKAGFEGALTIKSGSSGLVTT